jgi:hypothetical protein
MAGSDLQKATAAAASATEEGDEDREVVIAAMEMRGGSSKSSSVAAPANQALTCRREGLEEHDEGRTDLVALAGEDAEGRRSGRLRR